VTLYHVPEGREGRKNLASTNSIFSLQSSSKIVFFRLTINCQLELTIFLLARNKAPSCKTNYME